LRWLDAPEASADAFAFREGSVLQAREPTYSVWRIACALLGHCPLPLADEGVCAFDGWRCALKIGLGLTHFRGDL